MRWILQSVVLTFFLVILRGRRGHGTRSRGHAAWAGRRFPPLPLSLTLQAHHFIKCVRCGALPLLTLHLEESEPKTGFTIWFMVEEEEEKVGAERMRAPVAASDRRSLCGSSC